jgi:hypothetical protein
MTTKKLLLLCCFAWLANNLCAQQLDSLRVTYRADNQPLTGIFKALEGLTKCSFFYSDTAWARQKMTIEVQNQPLALVLDRLVQGSEMGYLFYRDYAVILMPKEVLNTVYTADYYNTLSVARRQKDSTMVDLPNQISIGSSERIHPTGRAKVNFRIRDEEGKEPIGGAAVSWPNLTGKNTATDKEGQTEIVIPTGEQIVTVQAVGYVPFEGRVLVWNDGSAEIRLQSMPNLLSEVQIKADAADANVSKAQIGVTRLDPKAIKKLPTLLGEADVVRSLLLTTGVTSVGEGASGFNVRGGDTDQNLMLQDEMILFNSSHALGFFSTFNTDLVSKVELYKSIIPAEYGGRLSSVLDVRMSEGNTEKWKMKGGVGLVSGRLGAEGPLRKGSTSLSIGGRVSYADWVLKLFRQLELRRSSASFYDANMGITHRWKQKNSLTISMYSAGDQFTYNNLFGFDYRTFSGQLIYKRSISEQFFSRFSLSVGDYQSEQSNQEGVNSGTLRSGIRYYKMKESLSRRWHSKLKTDAGIEGVYYQVQPGTQAPIGSISNVVTRSLEREQAAEAAIWVSGEWDANTRLTLTGGARLNHYRFLGAKTVLTYSGTPSIANISDTIAYGSGSTIAQFTYAEPRFSLRYRLNRRSSIKTGYSRTSQFVNQIFNTDTPTPTSQFQLSTPYIPPFRAHNVAAGYFYNTYNNQWEMSGEVFYRNIDKLWDYRDFAKLTVNPNLETEIRQGKGLAYGFELSAKTNRPLYNGQLGYTYSRALRQVGGINKGQWYASNFDKPHVLNMVFNYQPSQRHTLTFNFTYSTGRPTTAPLTSYRLGGNIIVPVYAPRNQSRIPDYHRLDIAYTIGQGYNKRKTFKTSWNLSLYNVYARKNAFSVFFSQAPDLSTVANRLAILGTVFPAITLNIETK